MVQPICILKAVAFVDLLAVGLIVPMLMIQARRIGANHIEIGLLGSIYAGFQLGSGPMIGSLSDIKGRKPILIMSLIISSLAYTAIGLANSIYTILLLRGVLGLFKQTQMLTRAMVSDYEKDEHKQGEIYGKMNAISGIGITLGPIIGGHVVEDYQDLGFQLIAVSVGLCFLINAGLIALLPAPIKKQRQPTSQCDANCTCEFANKREASINKTQLFISSLKQSYQDLRNIDWPQYGDIFIFKGLIGFAMGVYYSIYAAFLKETFDLTPKYVGYIISFQGIVGSISSYFIGFLNSFYVSDHDCSKRNYHVFLMLTIALLGMSLSYNVYMYVFWLIPLAVGNAVGRLITLEMVLNRGQGQHRGKLIGASNSVRSLSGVVSPMIAGVIGHWLGVGYVIYVSLMGTATGLILSYRYKHTRRKQRKLVVQNKAAEGQTREKED